MADGDRVPAGLVGLGRIAVAAVWAYEGLVAKIIGRRPDEVTILARLAERLPLLGDHPRALAIMIGSWELLLALVVIIGRLPRPAAVAQTATLLAFNAGGLFIAADQIAEPAHLLVTNAAFLVLVWVVAAALHARRAGG